MNLTTSENVPFLEKKKENFMPTKIHDFAVVGSCILTGSWD